VSGSAQDDKPFVIMNLIEYSAFRPAVELPFLRFICEKKQKERKKSGRG
jgi:hypothetical protein